MLDINYIRENPDEVKQAMKNRKFKDVDIDELLILDSKCRNLIKHEEELKAKKNQLSKNIPNDSSIKESRRIGEELKKIKPQRLKIEAQFNESLLKLPNIPQPEVPIGKDESDNVIIKTVSSTINQSLISRLKIFLNKIINN